MPTIKNVDITSIPTEITSAHPQSHKFILETSIPLIAEHARGVNHLNNVVNDSRTPNGNLMRYAVVDGDGITSIDAQGLIQIETKLDDQFDLLTHITSGGTQLERYSAHKYNDPYDLRIYRMVLDQLNAAGFSNQHLSQNLEQITLYDVVNRPLVEKFTEIYKQTPGTKIQKRNAAEDYLREHFGSIGPSDGGILRITELLGREINSDEMEFGSFNYNRKIGFIIIPLK